jgi:hypothetical protein
MVASMREERIGSHLPVLLLHEYGLVHLSRSLIQLLAGRMNSCFSNSPLAPMFPAFSICAFSAISPPAVLMIGMRANPCSGRLACLASR